MGRAPRDVGSAALAFLLAGRSRRGVRRLCVVSIELGAHHKLGWLVRGVAAFRAFGECSPRRLSSSWIFAIVGVAPVLGRSVRGSPRRRSPDLCRVSIGIGLFAVRLPHRVDSGAVFGDDDRVAALGRDGPDRSTVGENGRE